MGYTHNYNNMKNILILSLFSILALNASAQITGIGLSGTNLIYFPYDISKYEIVDTAQLIVSYNTTYPYTDIRNGETLAHDIMVLQIGNDINKFFSGNLDSLDYRRSFRKNVRVKLRQDYVPYIIYTDNGTGSVTTVNRYPFESDMASIYMEDIPEIDWKISEESDKISGYNCFKAIAQFRGRRWTVWFTPDIPLPYGPWKLQGLPGLIIKAEDADSAYSFTVQEIYHEAIPIIHPEWQYVKTTRKKWLRHEQDMHENPYIYFTKGGEYEIFNGWTKEVLDRSWTIPYNPIEFL
jgi:GLPGLI family protein